MEGGLGLIYSIYLPTHTGKSKNKDEIASLEEAMTGHKKHVAKLEQIIRLMDNDLLDPADIDEVGRYDDVLSTTHEK